MAMKSIIGDIPLLISIIVYIFLCPYTKVEESFNMQAMHDILEYGNKLSEYDHNNFPGVVPRTFIGALFISAISYPFHTFFLFSNASKFASQYLVRVILGILCWLAHRNFRLAVSEKFGTKIGFIVGIFAAMQFHLPFYMSRSLPNTFALLCSLHAFAFWMKGKAQMSLYILGFALVVFRCDLLILLIPLAITMLLSKEVPFLSTLLYGVITVLFSLMLTIIIDSYFWNRLLWPEGQVLFFNTALNKSSEWGTSPVYWYFLVAIPKALTGCLPFLLVSYFGLQHPSINSISTDSTNNSKEQRQSIVRIFHYFTSVFGTPNIKVYYYTLPAWAFVLLYSFLPHKELRFLFPVLPLLNIAVADGWCRITDATNTKNTTAATTNTNTNNKSNTTAATTTSDVKINNDTDNIRRVDYDILYYTDKVMIVLLRWVVGICCLLTVVCTLSLSKASYHNYAGGLALHHFHTNHWPQLHCGTGGGSTGGVTVHIDAEAAMSGITRFCEYRFPATAATAITEITAADDIKADGRKSCAVYYSKEEGLNGTHAFERFDWILTADPRSSGKETDFQIKEVVSQFSKILLTSLQLNVTDTFPLSHFNFKKIIKIPTVEFVLTSKIYIMRRAKNACENAMVNNDNNNINKITTNHHSGDNTSGGEK